MRSFADHRPFGLSEDVWDDEPSVREGLLGLAKTIGILVLVTLVSAGFDAAGFSEASIVITYVLGVMLTAIVTSERIWCFVSSALSVLAFNFFFTSPRYTFQAWGKEYPTTFATMFVVAFVVSWLAMQLRRQAHESAAAQRRTEVLLDTDRLLEECKTDDDIVVVMAGQLVRLFGCDVVWYPAEAGELGRPRSFPSSGDPDRAVADDPSELDVARWVLENNRRAGAGTDVFPQAKALYLAVRVDEKVFAVVGVVGDIAFDRSERGIALSIVGETALALERTKALSEREKAAVLAKNEQLRANLLRSISHDLRTPLTAISGNADILLDKGAALDEASRRALLSDIYDDALWLNDMVENLLSITKLEDSAVSLNMSVELVEEVIDEALRHVSREARRHEIEVVPTDDILLARMDARLVIQVIDNLVNNAIQYTPPGSHIRVSSARDGDFVAISVADDGDGISDADKEHIFDSFYTANHGLADGHRSVGLGLALCKSIAAVHGGTITVADNHPKGTVFRFTLPAEEVPENVGD